MELADPGRRPSVVGLLADLHPRLAVLDVGVDRKAPLGDLYDAAMIDEIVGGLDVGKRWGVAEGQLALASKMINSQVINRVFREYFDGEIDASAAVAAINDELAAIE